MKRRIALVVALAAALGWLAFGAFTLHRRAPRAPPATGEARGAWHVHTTRSDGRYSPAEVVRAAREAGLQFVVLADHNALVTSEAGYRDGVLVVVATEISSVFGHVVAVGLPDSPGEPERRDPLGRTATAGGAAVIAHPLHPRRPFGGWGKGPWRGFEALSNDAAWYEAVHGVALGRLLPAALALPFDGSQTVLWLLGRPAPELARFDAEAAAARREGRALPALLCSADAHGYPSYRAAFEAFSMRAPVALTGEATADTRAVLAALLGGRSACVLDGVAPASGVRLERLEGGGIGLSLESARREGGVARLYRDGAPAEAQPLPAAGPVRLRFCGAGCAPGSYRVEVTLEGRPWIFTNPLAIE